RRIAGYHGGNRYEWLRVPRFVYKAFGRGEVNPMLAVHSGELTTTVNVLNTHGDLEENFAIDARLYDCAGGIVADRKRWLSASRRSVSRGTIAELLPRNADPFIGHIALNFADDGQVFFPRHVQALVDYAT